MRTVVAVAALAILVVTGCGRQPDPSPPASTTQQHLADPASWVVAAPVDPDPRVGALFFGAGDLHTCTGAVLHSAGGDLVLTAAHCLSDGTQVTFVPGFSGAAAPPDTWTLDTVYLDPRWTTDKDPHADYAIARVSRGDGASIEAQAGSALTLGTAPEPGTAITVVAYPAGVGGTPIGCRAKSQTAHGGYPAVPCAGLVDGTSGAPWITGSTVRGVVGGLDGGGCEENVSYSAPFDEHTAALLARAEAGGPGDAAPPALTTEC
ncbi:trypsin [Mycobacterium kyorinense]|uniref:Trypsin n=1 Tax=Mycobacterium kyorinense TaxID=487514 RepID=A0A1A2YQU3_9MYCO|nr:trypsin-like peptidase domain-containing protein [Mycobacterium kyorinense]OBI40619.1 trypsin [Mycobacterium kyorinense]